MKVCEVLDKYREALISYGKLRLSIIKEDTHVDPDEVLEFIELINELLELIPSAEWSETQKQDAVVKLENLKKTIESLENSLESAR